jgi:hypothetical protein
MGNFQNGNTQRSRRPEEHHRHKVVSGKVTPIRPEVEKEPDKKKEVEPPPLPVEMGLCLGGCRKTLNKAEAWAKYGEGGVCGSVCNDRYLASQKKLKLDDQSIPWMKIDHF